MLLGAEDNNPFINLDSVFCGIFPEEVAELRKMDDKYLKAVNIVPVMPSWSCLKSESINLFAIVEWLREMMLDLCLL